MSIQTEITRLENAKADIINAINNKGVNVPNNVLLNDVSNYILQIQGVERYLTQDIEDGTESPFLSMEDNGTEISLSITFNE